MSFIREIIQMLADNPKIRVQYVWAHCPACIYRGSPGNVKSNDEINHGALYSSEQCFDITSEYFEHEEGISFITLLGKCEECKHHYNMKFVIGDSDDKPSKYEGDI